MPPDVLRYAGYHPHSKLGSVRWLPPLQEAWGAAVPRYSVRGAHGTPEAGTRAAYVQWWPHTGQAALCLRYVRTARGGGWYAQYGGPGT